MKKSKYIFFLAFLFIGCNSSYRIITDNTHIIVNENNTKFYENDSLNLSMELYRNRDLVPSEQTFRINSVVKDKLSKKVLSLTGFDKKKDTILYTEPGNCIIVLKNNIKNKTSFMEYNVDDSVVYLIPKVLSENKSYIIFG